MVIFINNRYWSQVTFREMFFVSKAHSKPENLGAKSCECMISVHREAVTGHGVNSNYIFPSSWGTRSHPSEFLRKGVIIMSTYEEFMVILTAGILLVSILEFAIHKK